MNNLKKGLQTNMKTLETANTPRLFKAIAIGVPLIYYFSESQGLVR